MLDPIDAPFDSVNDLTGYFWEKKNYNFLQYTFTIYTSLD